VRRHHHIPVILVPALTELEQLEAERFDLREDPNGAVLSSTKRVKVSLGDRQTLGLARVAPPSEEVTLARDRFHREKNVVVTDKMTPRTRRNEEFPVSAALSLLVRCDILRRSDRAPASGGVGQERQVRAWRSRSISSPDRWMVAGPRPTISMVSPGVHSLIASVSRLSSRRSCRNAAMPRTAGIHSSITR
jgi:hypothetical protein